MKKITILYWVCTSLLTLVLGIGSVMVFLSPEAGEPVTRLGYPTYLPAFLGVARLLALGVILIPSGYALLKEWAYAGLAFDLIGAIYSHIAFGDPITQWLGILPPVLFLVGSYVFYHKKLKSIDA
jgi:hypothetical protein